MHRLMLAAKVLTLIVTAPALAGPLTVSGTLRAPEGGGLAAARVELKTLHSNFEWSRGVLAGRDAADPVATTRTDAAGRFSLEAPGVGLYRVVVEAAGFVPMRRVRNHRASR